MGHGYKGRQLIATVVTHLSHRKDLSYNLFFSLIPSLLCVRVCMCICVCVRARARAFLVCCGSGGSGSVCVSVNECLYVFKHTICTAGLIGDDFYLLLF